MTSQSSVICRSPSFCRSTTERKERPISRWISCVRPLCLPRAASRLPRVCVARGSIEYSPVTQPSPLPRIHGGTFRSTLAVHSTRVSPKLMRHEPSACLVKPVSMVMARISSGARPEGRIIVPLIDDLGAALVARGLRLQGQSLHCVDVEHPRDRIDRPRARDFPSRGGGVYLAAGSRSVRKRWRARAGSICRRLRFARSSRNSKCSDCSPRRIPVPGECRPKRGCACLSMA